MKRFSIAALLMCGAARAAAGEDNSDVEQSADFLLLGIPVMALGLTYLVDEARPETAAAGFTDGVFSLNGEPRRDLGLALLRSTTVSYGLKYAVDEERPNGKDGAFPSAHTSVTFAGAEFIRKQYGWSWGAPAYAAAGYVGWSRVETDHHWWRDVVAGAAIGVFSNYDLSDLRTRWGVVALQPMVVRAPAELAPGVEVSTIAPGLVLELRF